MGYILVRGERREVSNDKPVDLHLPDLNIIIKNSVLSEGLALWANLNIYGARIGAHTKIASFVEIRSGVSIGYNCKIEPFAFLPEGVTIGNGVFIGPNVTFTNDKYPKACGADGGLIAEYEITKTVVENNVSLGAGSTVICGIKIAAGTMLGAGGVLTKDTGENELWIGAPATRVRKL